MPQFKYDPNEFGGEVQKFINAAKVNPADYGTSAARLTELQNLLDPVVVAAQEVSEMETALAAKRAQLAGLRVALEDDFRGERNDAYDHASDDELIAAGLEPHKKASKTTPTPPQNLMATGGADGINHLRWEAGANPRTSDYVIYARTGEQPRRMIDVVRTLKYDHSGQTPGVTVIYDVEARRRNLTSQPSNQAIVFGP